VCTNVPDAFFPVTSTLYVPLVVAEAAEMVSVALTCPPAVSVDDPGIEQVTPEVAEHVRLTAPLNPLVELSSTATVLLLPGVTGTTVVAGTSWKSERGFAIALVSTIADGR
jgi:hypothetical protein